MAFPLFRRPTVCLFYTRPRLVALLLMALAFALSLSGCGTAHRLPPYERPVARTEFQTVRTTAYTHTEADHLAYGDHNALGGTLHAAPRPARPILGTTAAIPVSNRQDNVDEAGGFHRQPFNDHVAAPSDAPAYPPDPSQTATVVYGSAAADWSRWPAGTVFQLASTGQTYRVDDYGWALAGRNTIDLYQSSRAAMNAWGVRRESIRILQWGSRDESLRRLRNHQKYKHIRRMVLELEGHSRAAARLN